MIISNSKNFIYIHIEKTGGTSIEEALTPILNNTDMVLGGITVGNEMENFYGKIFGYKTMQEKMLWKHSDAKKIKEMLGKKWDEMYKFSTVRDPMQIMISFYFYIKRIVEPLLINNFTNVIYDASLLEEIKYDGSTVYTDDLRYLYFIQSQLDDSGIDGFIYKMITNNLKEVAPQISKVDESVELFDIANIKNDWPLILNKIGINDDIQLHVHNSSNRPQNIKLNNETLDLILNHFKNDYELIDDKITKNWIIK